MARSIVRSTAVVAFVVVSASAGNWSLEAARDWVSAAHPRSWAPREVVTLDALPLLDNGKPDRLALRELA